MRSNSRINTSCFIFLSFFFFACESKLTPCECGRNLSKSYSEVNQDLELRCREHVLNLSEKKREIWNKQVLDCTEEE